MPSPFFSIIIPTYNSASTLQKALDSLYHQTFTDFEILLIDGLSKDETIDMIHKNAGRDSRIRFISEKDLGVYDAFNKGIRMSEAEWLYFLGSDDQMHNPKVLQQIFDRLVGTDYDLVYGNVLFTGRKKPYDGRFNRDKLLERNISHQAIFYNRKVFMKLGGFNTRYKIMADWEMNLKCFFKPEFKDIFTDLIIADFAVEGISRQMDIPFLREVLLNEKLNRINELGPAKYLWDISRYDSCWRLFRNAKISGKDELQEFNHNQVLPPGIEHMIKHQSKIKPELLKNGFISKTCMFISWLISRIS